MDVEGGGSSGVFRHGVEGLLHVLTSRASYAVPPHSRLLVQAAGISCLSLVSPDVWDFPLLDPSISLVKTPASLHILS